MSTNLATHLVSSSAAFGTCTPSAGQTADMVRSVLVASRGDACSRAAARVARELVAPQTEVAVVAVEDPFGKITARLHPGDGTPSTESLAVAVRQQLDGCGCSDWPILVQRGDAATAISHTAAELGTSLIVIGLSEHGMLDRALHRETTLRVLRHAQTPVMAVVPWAIGRPRTIVCAIDFSPASVRAARLAASLAGPHCRLFLVHVMMPIDESAPGARSFSNVVAQGADDALVRLARDIRLPADGRVDSLVVRGTPGEELLSVAAHVGADLIAVGARLSGIL